MDDHEKIMSQKSGKPRSHKEFDKASQEHLKTHYQIEREKEWKKKKNYLKVGCPRCGEHLVYDNNRQKMVCLNKECRHYKK